MDPTELPPTEDEPQPRPYTDCNTLLKKYDIPIGHLDFPYVEKCTSGKELERILHILQSGEEGHYPQLTEKTAERLAKIKPNSRFLRKLTPVVALELLDKELKQELKGSFESWFKDVADQDQELNQHKNTSSLQDIPEIRQSKEQACHNNPKSDKRIKSTDYASWDKYDPDTEILKMDLETEKLKSQVEKPPSEKKEKPRKSVKFAEFLTTTEAAVESTREKDKGNEYYRSGDFKSAVLCYTNSINFQPSSTNYNNRAQAHIKLKLFKEAVDDCRAAIKYEPDNVKAQLRLAQSLQELKMYQEAVTHAERVVQLEPNNVVAQNLLNKLNQQIGVVFSPKKKTRMKIVEIDNKFSASPLKKVNKMATRKSILKKSSSNVKKNHVLLPIPGPSTMPEPYYIVADNKDPEMVKLQEFVINNKPEALFLGSIDIDDEECPVIHNSRHEKNFQDDDQNERLQIMEITEEDLANETLANNKAEVNENEDEAINYDISDKNHDLDEEKNITKMEEVGEKKNQQKIIDNLENIKNNQENVYNECIPSTSSVLNNTNYTLNTQKNNNNQQIILQNNQKPGKPTSHYRTHKNITTNNLETNENRENPVSNPNTTTQNCNSLRETHNQPGGGGEPHLELNGNTNGNNENVHDIHMPFSFLKAWNAVQRDETYAQHAQILRGLDEQQLVQVIGFKLDGTMLTDILRALYLHFTVPHEVERLHTIITHITTLPRFSISAMFLSKQDKIKTKGLFEFLEQHGKPLSEDIKQIFL